uniref:putative 7-carboxy-7-deazaguanine synthase QueE n=1 Tax=Eubacterium cellulosolvens TaxID=29322 RepID=UPI00048260D1|nr:putative 7-carboxy-7-deazaguanine synthase QueE [[Eubacterium] cellulosolvens]
MKVVEKFISINGEGTRAGELAVFVRFRGCNLNCSYCDTMWANEPGCPCEDETPEQIVSYIEETKVKNVTLTGGEPLLQKEMPELLHLLAEKKDLRVEIETNGAVDLSGFRTGEQSVFTMDYKLPSSGCESGMLTENFRFLEQKDTVKFVVGSQEDLDRAGEIIREYGLIGKCHVYFSPVFGKIEPEQIVNYMIEHRLNGARIQIQIHKVIWDPNRRGV